MIAVQHEHSPLRAPGRLALAQGGPAMFGAYRGEEMVDTLAMYSRISRDRNAS